MASNNTYHLLQAKTLLELANSTDDPHTATALRDLAAEHMKLARAADGEPPEGWPKPSDKDPQASH